MNDDSDDRYAGIDIDCLLNRNNNRRGLAYSRKKALYEAPEFLQRLNGEETLMEGQSLCLECKVRGFPVPVLRWYKDDEEISNHPRIKIETNGHGGYALVIDNVTRGDEACYRCRAENVEGACSSVFFLSVKAKPKSKSNSNRGSNRRTVSFPPMFSTIVEKVEEEEKQGKEFEQLPPSPLIDFYYAINLKGRATWPAFLGEWAFKTGGRRGSDADVAGDDGDEPMSPSEGRAKARLRRSDLTARVEAKKQRLDEERKKKEADEKEEAARKKKEVDDEAARKRKEEEEEARKLETKIIMEREERRRKRAALEEESEKKEEAMRKRREARAARLEKERKEREEEEERILKEQEEEREKKRRLEDEAREEKERREKEEEEKRRNEEMEEAKRREEQKRLEERKKNEELQREAEEKKRKQEELEKKEAESRRAEEQLRKENEEKKKKAKEEQEAQKLLEEKKKKEDEAKKKKPENAKLKEKFENLARKEDILNNNESGSLKRGPKALQMFQEKADTKPSSEPIQKKPSQNNVLNRFKEKLAEPEEASKDAGGSKPGVLPKQGQVNKLKPPQAARDRSPTPAISRDDTDINARSKSPLKAVGSAVADDKSKTNVNSVQKPHKDNEVSKTNLKQNNTKPVEDGKASPPATQQQQKQPPSEPKWKTEMRLREEAKRKQEESKKTEESKGKGETTEPKWKQALNRQKEKDPKEEKKGSEVSTEHRNGIKSKPQTLDTEKQKKLTEAEEKKKKEAEQREKQKQEEVRKKELAQKELAQKELARKKKENEEKQAKKEKEEQEKRRIEMRKEQMIKEQLKRQEEEMKQRQEREIKKRREEETRKRREKQKREQADTQQSGNDDEESEVKVYKRDYSFSDLRKSLETTLKGGGDDIIGEEEHKYWDDILTKHNYSVGDIKKTLGNLASGSATLDRPSRMRSRRNSVEELEIVKMKRSSSISDLRESFTKSLERPKSKKKASDPEKAKKHEELLKRTTNVGETRQQLLETAKKQLEPLTFGMSSKEADITIRNLKVKDVQSELSVPRVSPSRLHSASPEPPSVLKSVSVDVKSKRTSFHELISLQQTESSVELRSGTSVVKKDVSKRISYHGQFDAYGSRTIPAYKRVAGWADDIGRSREEEPRAPNPSSSSTKLSSQGAERKRLNPTSSLGKAAGSSLRDGSQSPESIQQDTGVRPFVFNSTRTIARRKGERLTSDDFYPFTDEDLETTENLDSDDSHDDVFTTETASDCTAQAAGRKALFFFDEDGDITTDDRNNRDHAGSGQQIDRKRKTEPIVAYNSKDSPKRSKLKISPENEVNGYINALGTGIDDKQLQSVSDRVSTESGKSGYSLPPVLVEVWSENGTRVGKDNANERQINREEREPTPFDPTRQNNREERQPKPFDPARHVNRTERESTPFDLTGQLDREDREPTPFAGAPGGKSSSTRQHSGARLAPPSRQHRSAVESQERHEREPTPFAGDGFGKKDQLKEHTLPFNASQGLTVFVSKAKTEQTHHLSPTGSSSEFSEAGTKNILSMPKESKCYSRDNLEQMRSNGQQQISTTPSPSDQKTEHEVKKGHESLINPSPKKHTAIPVKASHRQVDTHIFNKTSRESPTQTGHLLQSVNDSPLTNTTDLSSPTFFGNHKAQRESRMKTYTKAGELMPEAKPKNKTTANTPLQVSKMSTANHKSPVLSTGVTPPFENPKSPPSVMNEGNKIPPSVMKEGNKIPDQSKNVGTLPSILNFGNVAIVRSKPPRSTAMTPQIFNKERNFLGRYHSGNNIPPTAAAAVTTTDSDSAADTSTSTAAPGATTTDSESALSDSATTVSDEKSGVKEQFKQGFDIFMSALEWLVLPPLPPPPPPLPADPSDDYMSSTSNAEDSSADNSRFIRRQARRSKSRRKKASKMLKTSRKQPTQKMRDVYHNYTAREKIIACSPFGHYSPYALLFILCMTFLCLSLNVSIEKFICYILACFYSFCVLRIVGVIR